MTYNLQKWTSPIILAVICQQAIRLITDISIDKTFWVTPSQHLKELIISPPFFYLIDRGLYLLFIEKSGDKKERKSVIKEYGPVVVYFSLCTVITVFIIHSLLNLQNYFRDYVIAVIVWVPVLLCYFTLRRNEYNKKRVAEQILELEKIKAAKLETDMRFLKAQYHPHFLFNALNTIYFQVHDNNTSAKESIELLSELLRYQLYESEKQVTLDEEISFLNAYITFQELRMDDEIKVNFQVEIDGSKKEIHPLLFHPLLENAFKYVDGKFYIDIKLNQQNNTIVFSIVNTIISYPESEQKTGIGLISLKQRLSILYPGKHELSINKGQDTFTVMLIIKVE